MVSTKVEPHKTPSNKNGPLPSGVPANPGVQKHASIFCFGNLTFGASTSRLFLYRRALVSIGWSEHKIDTQNQQEEQQIDTNRHEYTQTIIEHHTTSRRDLQTKNE